MKVARVYKSKMNRLDEKLKAFTQMKTSCIFAQVADSR